MKTAKVFKSGNSQAVRIPKSYNISEDELIIQKVGNTIILTPKDDVWESFDNSIKNFSDDLFEDSREQPKMLERESL